MGGGPGAQSERTSKERWANFPENSLDGWGNLVGPAPPPPSQTFWGVVHDARPGNRGERDSESRGFFGTPLLPCQEFETIGAQETGTKLVEIGAGNKVP